MWMSYDNSVDIEKEVKESQSMKLGKLSFFFFFFYVPFTHVIGPDAQEWKDKLYAVVLEMKVLLIIY